MVIVRSVQKTSKGLEWPLFLWEVVVISEAARSSSRTNKAVPTSGHQIRGYTSGTVVQSVGACAQGGSDTAKAVTGLTFSFRFGCPTSEHHVVRIGRIEQ